MPDEIRAGDSLLLQQAFAEYTPAEWDLTTEIVGSSGDLGAFVAVDDGEEFATTITAATTATWAAGSYTWQQYMTAGVERRTVGDGTLLVLANLATVATHDGRSHVKVVLDALEAMIENKATSDQMSYSIGDRALSRMTPSELMGWYQRYKMWYAQETREERIAAGLGHRGKIRTRFIA